MNKKLLLVGIGILLVVVSFFVGIKYREVSDKGIRGNELKKDCPVVSENIEVNECVNNNGDDAVKEDSLPTLDSLLTTSNLYSAGESRTILPLKGIEATIALGFVYEVKTIMDQENHLLYRIYRVGQGDYPPTYSEGRLFLQVVDSTNYPSYVWAMLDTEIDRVEPLGEVYVQGGKLIITCAKKQTIGPALPCEYQLDYLKENQNLRVIRSI